MDSWRLILDERRPAADNMAVDEAIMAACAAGDAPPTIRIYDWSSPAISLGYFQSLEKSRIDLEYCRERGIDLVRRPTGGRAVLHGHDVTFSVVVEESRVPTQGVLAGHMWIMRGVVRAFELLGVSAHLGPSGTDLRKASSGDCFAHVAECDVRSKGGKAAGAAQLRRSGVLLEQGSVPHVPPDVDYARVFGLQSADPGSLSPPLADVPRQRVEEVLSRGFAEAMDVDLQPGDLSEVEIAAAKCLVEAKYASPDWTFQRLESVDNAMLNCYTGQATVRGERSHAEENPRR